ncbi:uncharacterized protein LOC115622201 [Scaptodrosophila lebanonensis]|uniref:Uncharacterized protein LOC115622201 n=1 Tax=Drosophila lebanonensis TaxID=7225 RepID=A0A6J2T4U5_DROLE|nr:uncharacterized protein LOC115622201 [Scaptodrosophila lebanonensis]
MPVRPTGARTSNNKLNISLVLLLLFLFPVQVTAEPENCSFIDGLILQHDCRGTIDRELRLSYKDHHLAIDTPYAIWKREDYMGTHMLLIVFYETPLFSCYNLVFSNEQFYCNGQNAAMELERPYFFHCLPFSFSYVDDLFRKCEQSSDQLLTQQQPWLLRIWQDHESGQTHRQLLTQQQPWLLRSGHDHDTGLGPV